MSTPIRVGFVGLSSTPGFGNGSSDWAGSAHIEYLLASPKYKLVALANSSIQAAEKCISVRKLDPAIKAYGSVQDLAMDPNVDLIVISVAVQKHFALAMPALEAGKDVYVEWPLGVNTQEAEKLTQLAASKGVRTIVGAQGRQNQFIRELKQIVDSGRIGNVKSTTIIARWAPFFQHDSWFKSMLTYQDQSSGGNHFTIQFAHVLESLSYVLGGFSTVNSALENQYPIIKLLDGEGNIVDPLFKSTAYDFVSLQGRLTSGAIANVVFRMTAGSPVSEDVGLRWIITGDDGEAEVVLGPGSFQIASSTESLKVRAGKDSEVETTILNNDIDNDVVKNVGPQGKNIARAYEAFANKEHRDYVTFEDGLRLHNLLDMIEAGKI